MCKAVEELCMDSAILAYIDACKDFGKTQTEAADAVMAKFSLSNTTAEECVQRVWRKI